MKGSSLKDVRVPVEVVLGGTELTVEDLQAMIGGVDHHQLYGRIIDYIIKIPDHLRSGMFIFGFVLGSFQDLRYFISRVSFEKRTVKDESRHSIRAECSVD